MQISYLWKMYYKLLIKIYSSDKEDEEDMEDLSKEGYQDIKDEEVIEEFLEDKINDEDENMKKNSKCISNDVHEGKTVFLKNVPFSVKNEELKKYMEQFGPVYYALICVDSLTEHSKGTAFVKFKVMNLYVLLLLTNY